jgi:hypothetical protein
MFVRDDLQAYYGNLHNHESRPLSSAIHSVFFIEELRRYIMSFIGPDKTIYNHYEERDYEECDDIISLV